MKGFLLGLALLAGALLLLAGGWRYRVASGALYLAAAGYVWYLGRGKRELRDRVRVPLLGFLFLGAYFLLTGIYQIP